MNAPPRFPDSVFDRIGAYLPAEQREMFFRYVTHLRTLDPGDSLLVLAEGMAVFTCLARQVPEALVHERKELLGEFSRLCAKYETATTNATTDVRAMFTAHQKLLEQNMAAWQNREQQAVESLDRIAKRFEESAASSAAKLQANCAQFQTATVSHEAAAMKAREWVQKVSLGHCGWPYAACAAGGALVTIAVRYFIEH